MRAEAKPEPAFRVRPQPFAHPTPLSTHVRHVVSSLKQHACSQTAHPGVGGFARFALPGPRTDHDAWQSAGQVDEKSRSKSLVRDPGQPPRELLEPAVSRALATCSASGRPHSACGMMRSGLCGRNLPGSRAHPDRVSKEKGAEHPKSQGHDMALRMVTRFAVLMQQPQRIFCHLANVVYGE